MNPKMTYHITNITAHPFENKHVKKIIDNIIRKLKLSNPGHIRICDPFSNNKTIRRQGTTLITNDLNPKFGATYNMEANDFGELMENKDIQFDLILFDPPYSLRQLKEQYENIGEKLPLWQTQNKWGRARNSLANCVASGGYVISFGWESSGFGRARGFELQELHVLNQAGHADRYDLLIAVEKKITNDLFAYISCDD